MSHSNLNRLCMVLNASYEPINITTVRHALTLIFKGVAIVEDVSEHMIHTAKMDFPVPDVIRLASYRRVPRATRSISRKGIMLRDGSVCQYCNKKFPLGDLTLDHVIP